jgi:hypothetical protein
MKEVESNSNKEKRTQLLNTLPKYIFDAEHSKLKSVDSIIKNIQEYDTSLHTGEVSEYPIEYYENQKHAIERHMNITYVFEKWPRFYLQTTIRY